ncbi:alpha/beta hydrolase [Enemella evansiae]|uniref:alpha/beta hydrolase n=1 Tax=Enemella evansiae TaxID=2016499 RepID=UPI001E2C0151|nr:alpha/beta fold hydrolase [Enemella evansiae]
MVTDEQAADALIAEHAAPIHGGSGEVGVLLCHGFTGTPWSMREWAEYLIEAGYRVSVPLWPGHGTTWQQLNDTTWEEWYAAAETALRELRQQCDTVFVGGLSMGGGMALRLAERQGSDIRGLVLVNPAIALSDKRLLVLPVLSRFVPSLAAISGDIAKPGADEYGYRRTPLKALLQQTRMWLDIRTNLDRVDQPILMFRSEQDHVVDPTSARLIQEGVSSAEVTERVLTRSYHVATMDYEAEDIFAESAEFFGRHSARAAEAEDA